MKEHLISILYLETMIRSMRTASSFREALFATCDLEQGENLRRL